MERDIYNSYLLINTSRIRANIRSILASLPAGAELIPMLKCNAYGFGLAYMAKLVSEFPSIRMAAVAQVLEALELRRCGFERKILVTGASASSAQRRAAIENGVTLTAYSADFIRLLNDDADAVGRPADVHIKINTGLNRLGFCPGAELDGGIAALRECVLVRPSGVFSHFSELEAPASAEADEQYIRFTDAVTQLQSAGIEPGLRHICASAAFEFHPEMALDAVRIGRRLYYDNPIRPDGGVAEAASWRAVITDVRLRRAGSRLGYGNGLTLEKDTKTAMLGIGYGDGLFQTLVSAHAPVLVNGRRARLLCCCMDQCFVDVSGIDCSPGDEATLFGQDGSGKLLPAQDIAALMRDEACTITAALGPRVCKIYE